MNLIIPRSSLRGQIIPLENKGQEGSVTESADDKSQADTLQLAAGSFIKTCFNGLYRVNSSGEFNVPSGRYKNPTICNEDNLLGVHGHLQKAEIICGDFALCLERTDNQSFVYFDPPYRPISSTANFTSYANHIFDDTEQKRLRKVYGELDKQGAFVMLSNSNPKNLDSEDDFFDDLYSKYRIERLTATRLINCNAEKRGTDIRDFSDELLKESE